MNLTLSKSEIEQLDDSSRLSYFMCLAIEEAKKAEAINEVPIGAIVVKNNEVIGRGYNLREHTQNSTSHAELIAIQKANQTLNNFRLEECELFVTLEPCTMCSGAIILSRLKSVIYGASDFKAGTCGTLMNLVQDKRFNHRCTIIKGIEEKKCQNLLTNFFKKIRKKSK